MTLKNGSKGQEVKRLQSRLGGIQVDGVFGTETENRVRQYQTDVGLTVDGIAGWLTQVSLGMPIRSGIDISHYQGTIQWASLPRDRVQFVFAKATEGVDFVDAKFGANRQGAWDVAIPFGAYHFGQPGNPWQSDLDNFCRTVGVLRSSDLPPVLDIEATGGLSVKTLRNWVQAWLDGCQQRLGAKPILYVGASFSANQLGGCKGLGDYAHLWIADWGDTEPAYPTEWSGWSFWQYTNKGTITGITGNVDLDYAAGNVPF